MKKFGLVDIESQYNIDSMPIWALNRNCKLWGYRVELWKYGHKRGSISDYRDRNKIILHKEK